MLFIFLPGRTQLYRLIPDTRPEQRQLAEIPNRNELLRYHRPRVGIADFTNLEAKHLARISHHSSTVAALCGIPRDFHSVRALNSVSTMLAHPPNNVCRFWQTLLGVIATNLPGADLNSSAGPKGGGHDCRDAAGGAPSVRRSGGRAMQRDAAFRSDVSEQLPRRVVRNAG
jgi:hypothetical protein